MGNIGKKKFSSIKKIFFFSVLFFFSVSIPLSAYFLSGERNFDDRTMAWWDIDVKKDSGGDKWWDLDFSNKGGDWAKSTTTKETTTKPTPTTTTPPATNTTSSTTSGSVKINNFTINPSKVQVGGTANVSWSATNANSCTLYRDGTASLPASANESRKVNITVGAGTYRYELVCKNSSGNEARLSKTLTVVASGTTTSTTSSVVKITKFVINPLEVEEKGSVDVSWSAENATSCTLSRDGLASQPAGANESRKVNITVGAGSYRYELVCRNAAGNEDKLVRTLKVKGSSVDSKIVKISKFTIEPSRIEEGGIINVAWETENAVGCTLNGLPVGTKDSQSGTVSQGVGKHDYELVCRNSAGNEARLTRSLNVTGAVAVKTGEWLIGSCGRLDGKTFPSNLYDWPSNSFCSLGTPQPNPPIFPEAGKTVTWTCIGTSWPDSCSAKKQGATSSSGVSVDLIPGLVESCSTDEDCRANPPYEKCFENVCLKGNVNNDEQIAMGDFVSFKKDFIGYKKNGWSENFRRSDIQIDGTINMADYTLFIKSYRIVNGIE